MDNLSWKNVNLLSDSDISYLLYKEGKDINTISRIRGLDKSIIEKQIIESKIKYRVNEIGEKPNEIVSKLYKYSRKERVLLIESLNEEKKKEIEEYVLENLFMVTRDECQFYIWILGELKSKRAVQPIITFLRCTDGNIKRICCSSLGKIGDLAAENALIGALADKRPQVRQYAAKALGKIKSKKSLSYLYKLMETDSDKGYIINAAKEAIDIIEGREQDE